MDIEQGLFMLVVWLEKWYSQVLIFINTINMMPLKSWVNGNKLITYFKNGNLVIKESLQLF